MYKGTGRYPLLTVGVAAVLVMTTGCGQSTTASDANRGETVQPGESVTPTAPTEDEAPEPEPAAPPEVALALDPSPPISLSIPSLDVKSDLLTTGLRSDRTLEVPPAYSGAPASWYDGSATPGSVGPAILLGHVNSTTDNNGVFRRISELVPGDEVTVTREDGSVATFEVYRNEAYPKAEFPTKSVYFPVRGAEIRLITCEGYIAAEQRHDLNRVIYAKLVATS